MNLQNIVLSFLIYALVMTAVIIILLIIQPVFFRRYSSKSRYAMWIITAAVMLIPFYLLPKPTVNEHEHKSTIIEMSAPEIEPVSFDIPVNEPYFVQPDIEPYEPESVAEIVTTPVIQPEPVKPITKITNNIEWYMIASMIWLIGFITVLIHIFASYVKFCQQIKRNTVSEKNIGRVIITANLSLTVRQCVCQIQSLPPVSTVTVKN